MLGLLLPLMFVSTIAVRSDLPHHDIDITAVDFDVGDRSTCAVTSGGKVFCWPHYRHEDSDDPVAPQRVDGISDAVAVAVSGHGACALHASKEISCWHYPTPIPSQLDSKPERATLSGVVEIRGSNGQVAALLDDGSIAYVRVDDAQAAKVRKQLDATQVSVSPWHNCWVTRDARVACEGRNDAGQLSGRRHRNRMSQAATEVLQLSNVTDVAAAGLYTCALRGGGSLFCWGGQFAAAVPAQAGGIVRVPTKRPLSQISAGNSRLCGVREDGVIQCWHARQSFELDFPRARRVVVGELMTCADNEEGLLRCWGKLGKVHQPGADPPEYPGAIGTWSLRPILGGGIRKRPERLAEAIFETGLRADLLFGSPHRDRRGWGMGPVFDFRTTDFDTWELGGGAGFATNIGHQVTVAVHGGVGHAFREGDESGRFAFASATLGLRGPFANPHPKKYGKTFLPFVIDTSLYASGRWGLERPWVQEWTFGVESPLSFAIGVGVMIYELFD